MVERKVLGLNVRRFLAAATGVMIGLSQMLKDAHEPSACEKLIMRFEGRQVNSDVLSAVTETEQIDVGQRDKLTVANLQRHTPTMSDNHPPSPCTNRDDGSRVTALSLVCEQM